jgi:hypothetical protein
MSAIQPGIAAAGGAVVCAPRYLLGIPQLAFLPWPDRLLTLDGALFLCCFKIGAKRSKGQSRVWKGREKTDVSTVAAFCTNGDKKTRPPVRGERLANAVSGFWRAC